MKNLITAKELKEIFLAPNNQLVAEIIENIAKRGEWKNIGGVKNVQEAKSQGTSENSGFIEALVNAKDAIQEKNAKILQINNQTNYFVANDIICKNKLNQEKIIVYEQRDLENLKSFPNIIFADTGIGQNSENMLSTFGGVADSTKVDKHYLQGLNGRGSMGIFLNTFTHTVNENIYQIIISKRQEDNYWGVFFKKLNPNTFELQKVPERLFYLALDNRIPIISDNELAVLAQLKEFSFFQDLINNGGGTILKVFNFKLINRDDSFKKLILKNITRSIYDIYYQVNKIRAMPNQKREIIYDLNKVDFLFNKVNTIVTPKLKGDLAKIELNSYTYQKLIKIESLINLVKDYEELYYFAKSLRGEIYLSARGVNNTTNELILYTLNEQKHAKSYTSLLTNKGLLEKNNLLGIDNKIILEVEVGAILPRPHDLFKTTRDDFDARSLAEKFFNIAIVRFINQEDWFIKMAQICRAINKENREKNNEKENIIKSLLTGGNFIFKEDLKSMKVDQKIGLKQNRAINDQPTICNQLMAFLNLKTKQFHIQLQTDAKQKFFDNAIIKIKHQQQEFIFDNLKSENGIVGVKGSFNGYNHKIKTTATLESFNYRQEIVLNFITELKKTNKEKKIKKENQGLPFKDFIWVEENLNNYGLNNNLIANLNSEGILFINQNHPVFNGVNLNNYVISTKLAVYLGLTYFNERKKLSYLKKENDLPMINQFLELEINKLIVLSKLY